LNHLQITDTQLEPIRRHRRRGRPAPGAQAPIVGYRYQLTAAMDSDARWLQLRHDSSFILATNELDTQRLSDADILAKYKGQARVERGFRFLKDPQFQATQLYLKNPQRITALLMVMTLSLLIYAALEYRLRKALSEQQQTVDNQQGKPTAKPSMRWIFQSFTGIHLLLLGGQNVQLLNLQPRHRKVLKLLGSAYEQLYS
jgi:transposase